MARLLAGILLACTLFAQHAVAQAARPAAVSVELDAYEPDTIIVNTKTRTLHYKSAAGEVVTYRIGVGRDGFTWKGELAVTRMAEWPDWIPPKEMLERQPWLPRKMAGGYNNPLGARAIYLGDTLYRIHGSNEPWTIGQAVSSGCFRMNNKDVIDLYARVRVGTKVVVLH